jgi:hypothetical protein
MIPIALFLLLLLWEAAAQEPNADKIMIRLVSTPWLVKVVEKCAAQCASQKFYGYFTFVTGTNNCYCAKTCQADGVNFLSPVAIESTAYQLYSATCTHGGVLTRLRAR